MHLLDVWIVTDRRIVDSTQKGFFDRTVSELRISRVQNISVKIVGPIETFLHFGDLEIQTAGSSDMFNFSQIPHPERVKDEIMAIVSTHQG
jgi:membrane protein YdbS with pleckstrin-like domain